MSFGGISGQDEGGQPFVAGVYPLLLDETCYFLAFDFDQMVVSVADPDPQMSRRLRLRLVRLQFLTLAQACDLL